MDYPVDHGCSSRVRLTLELGEETIIPLAQVAPDWIMPVEPTDLPPCEVDIVIQVDGVNHRRRMRLTEGMSAEDSVVFVSELELTERIELSDGVDAGVVKGRGRDANSPLFE